MLILKSHEKKTKQENIHFSGFIHDLEIDISDEIFLTLILTFHIYTDNIPGIAN